MSERITKGKAVLAGAVATLALAGVMHNRGGDSQPEPESQEKTSVSETGIYVVGKNDKTIGGIVEKIAAEGSGTELAEYIESENNDSATIQPGQRLEVPTDLLDESKTNVETRELPRNVGYNAEGELAPFGEPQEMNVITLDKGSDQQG